MNISMLREAEKQFLHSDSPSAGSPGTGISRFNFGIAARHKCLEPGRYLILMREYYGKGNSRRSGRFQLLAGS